MKKRIFIGFALLLLIFLLGSIVAVLFITKTTERMDKLIALHQVEILREDLIIHVQQVQSNIYHSRIWSSGDVDVLVSHVQEMDRVKDSCVGCHHTPELTQGLLAMRDLANDYKSAISRLVTVSANPRRIARLERRALDIGQELIAMTQGMAFDANVRLQQKTRETMATVRLVRGILFATLLAGFAIALIIAYALMKSLDRRIQKLLNATKRISHGELQHRVDVDDERESEFKQLGEAFNLMTRNLHMSQRQLVQSAKLAAIGELAANVAYEVNNPLTGVLGYTGLLLKCDDIPMEKKEHLKTIEHETLRAREILKNLLDFARRKPPRLLKTDIGALVQDALALVKGQARLNEIELVLSCPEGGVPPVAVDTDEMKQVFINLTNNAFLSMPKGGAFSVRCFHGRDAADRDVVTIEFSDTGRGIPEEQLDKIFDPFFSTMLEGDGAGLSLSVSYMIVQNHGGRIEVESKVGEGTTFRVVLPVEA
jgi:signal transduction histidine kinase